MNLHVLHRFESDKCIFEDLYVGRHVQILTLVSFDFSEFGFKKNICSGQHDYKSVDKKQIRHVFDKTMCWDEIVSSY